MRTRSLARLALLLPLAFCCASPALGQEPVVIEDGVVVVEEADPAAARDLDMTMDEVQSYQQTLKELGYFHGPADGRKGPRTRTALRNFQRDQGLAVSGGFDAETIARIDDQSRVARTETRPMPAEPILASAPSGGGGNVLTKIGGGAVTGVKAVGTAGKVAGKGLGTAGKTTGKAMATAGVATADASVASAKAISTAGVATAKGSVWTARTVAGGSTYVAKQTKRLFAGDSRTSDEQIRAAILSQYADDDRIVPGEVDVQVVEGNVTISLPEGARSDATHAKRLAMLTPGVSTVTAIYVSVTPE